MSKEYLKIDDKPYEVISKDLSYQYRQIYKLKDGEGVYYRLNIEDYREASFMYEKFHKAVINEIGKGQLKTIEIENIEYE